MEIHKKLLSWWGKFKQFWAIKWIRRLAYCNEPVLALNWSEEEIWLVYIFNMAPRPSFYISLHASSNFVEWTMLFVWLFSGEETLTLQGSSSQQGKFDTATCMRPQSPRFSHSPPRLSRSHCYVLYETQHGLRPYVRPTNWRYNEICK